MRRTTFWAAIVAGALMFVGVAGWANSDKRALEAQASTPIEAVDAFQMMLNAERTALYLRVISEHRNDAEPF
jgi:hypothetical protein